jgi:hypothetical protein
VDVDALVLVDVVETDAPALELDFEPLDEPHPASATHATHAIELTTRMPIWALTLA